MSLPGLATLLATVGRALRRRRPRHGAHEAAPAPAPAPTAIATSAPPTVAPLPLDDPLCGPLFERLRVAFPPTAPGFHVDELGIRTRADVVADDDDQGEWLDLVHAVRHARGQFVCLDLEAGHGRRLVRAARLVEQVNPVPVSLVGVEPDPARFASLHAHFRENGLDPGQHRLLRAGSLSELHVHTVVDLLVLGPRTADPDALAAADDELEARVKRVRIRGAGGAAAEAVRAVLAARGWEERRSGQVWVNPRFFAHHETFAGLARWSGHKPADFEADVLGSLIRHSYFEGYWKSVEPAQIEAHPLPPFDEEYFEWIDLLESVRHASGKYVMIELGAGFGRWAVRAALAVRALNPMPFTLVALEGEPTHFQWLREHLTYHGIDPDAHDLRPAAVSWAPGFTDFWVGKPGTWYGQRIAVEAGVTPETTPEVASDPENPTIRVPAVPLSDVLRGYPLVDLVDCDIQGHEAEVFGSAMDEMTQRVRRVHIGTHTKGIEDELRRAFTAHGWVCLWDYPCGATCETPYGLVTFGDGVQTWINPALA